MQGSSGPDSSVVGANEQGLQQIVLRAATAADQRLIRRLVLAEKLNPMELQWPNFLIAERHDVTPPRVVGIGQLRPHRDGSLELGSLVVVAEARGRGIGALLVHALIHKAGRPLILMCRGNRIGFYERFGFQCVTNALEVPSSLRWMYHAFVWYDGVLAFFGRKVPSGAFMAHPGVRPLHD